MSVLFRIVLRQRLWNGSLVDGNARDVDNLGNALLVEEKERQVSKVTAGAEEDRARAQGEGGGEIRNSLSFPRRTEP